MSRRNDSGELLFFLQRNTNLNMGNILQNTPYSSSSLTYHLWPQIIMSWAYILDRPVDFSTVV